MSNPEPDGSSSGAIRKRSAIVLGAGIGLIAGAALGNAAVGMVLGAAAGLAAPKVVGGLQRL